MVTFSKKAFTPYTLVRYEFVPVAFSQIKSTRLNGAVTLRLPKDPLFAKIFVVVTLVDVTSVKTPVEGVMLPIGVLSIKPPDIATLAEANEPALIFPILAASALIVEPLAVEKPNQLVEVPLVKVRSVIEPFAMTPLVKVPLVANKLVEVVLVPVALVQLKFAKEDGVVPVKTKLVKVALVAVKLVTVPFVMKALVVVALVVVALVKTAFCANN